MNVRNLTDSQMKELVTAIWAKLPDHVRGYAFAQHDAGWLSFYDAMAEFGVPDAKKLQPLIDLAKVSGWWLPYDTACVIVDRPCALHLDDQGRLHNEEGYALRYPSGWGVCAIHGVRVPERIVLEPENLTLDYIRTLDNAEVRRIATERYGMDRYLVETGAQIVDLDYVPLAAGSSKRVPRVLVQTDVGRYLVGQDGSTGRTYFMQVSNEAKTCKEAHESISGLPDEQCVAQS